MRIRIMRVPALTGIDGIRLDSFEVGKEYEVGNSIAALLLAEGWAEPVPLDAPKPALPFSEDDPFDSRVLYRDRNYPPNLVKDSGSPFFDRAIAANAQRRRRPRR